MKVAIIQGSVAPYRVDFFDYITKKYKDKYDFKIYYAVKPESFKRTWSIDEKKLNNSIFIKSKPIYLKLGSVVQTSNIPINVYKLLDEFKPDVIIGGEYNPSNLLAYTWSRKRNKKFISLSDGTLHTERDFNKLSKLIRKYVCKHADALIASSSKTKETQIFYGANKDNIFISYLSVDIQKYIGKNLKKNNGNLLYVGRLIKIKGLDLLFRALSRIDLEYKFHIVGDGDERKKLEILAQQLNIADKLIFYGYKEGEELRQIYLSCDIFIFPSLKDCYGLVLLEAMCAELSIISSKYAGATYDLVRDNGIVIDPYNIDEMKHSIEFLLKNPEVVDKQRSISKRMIKEFTFEKSAEQYIRAIEFSVIGDK